MRAFWIGLALLGLLGLQTATAAPLAIVAAENFYGDIAQQIGGSHVTVESILSNPDQDPHQFEASASTARKLADARIVIYSGIGYDSWVEKLLAASKGRTREVIEVAGLGGHKDGDNPHVWYDVDTVMALANLLGGKLAALDAGNAAAYRANLAALKKDLDALKARIGALRAKYKGFPVVATEPVFGYMSDAIGLAMKNQGFQTAMMNDTEPSASDVAAFEDALRKATVKALIYNNQVVEGVTERLLGLAKSSGVPVVGVTETRPPALSYQRWMNAQLDTLEQALSRK